MLLLDLHATVESLQQLMLFFTVLHQLNSVYMALINGLLLSILDYFMAIIYRGFLNYGLARIQISFAAFYQRFFFLICMPLSLGPAFRIRFEHSEKFDSTESEDFTTSFGTN